MKVRFPLVHNKKNGEERNFWLTSNVLVSLLRRAVELFQKDVVETTRTPLQIDKI